MADGEGQDEMRERCEEQGHDWENCCSVILQVYQRCKWCGEIRHINVHPHLPQDIRS